jgi:hypothetical protein
MAQLRFLADSPRPAPPRASPAARPASRRLLEQRLDCAEQELRLQFTRIAQLQAQLDVLAATLRPSRRDGRLR